MDGRSSAIDGLPVVTDLRDFDPRSGGLLERVIFRHRPAVLAGAALLTAILGAVAWTRTAVDADFERMIPAGHPYVATWRAHRDLLPGLGSSLRVVLEQVEGDIYDPRYLEALRDVTDALVLTPGVDRPWVRSLFMPGVRWTEVTEEGFGGGPVLPDGWDGGPAALEALRRNVQRAGLAGSLVADDARSSLVFVPLLDRDPVGGAGNDPLALSQRLEALRAEAEATGERRLRVVGFASRAGALRDGLGAVAALFAAAAAVVTLVLLLATRCVRSTLLAVTCAALGVVWQLGLVAALGIALDPFSALVPFLVFAMGVSHGAQKLNGVLQDVGRGTHPLVAARYTFRRLFAAGLSALLTDAAGFAALALVDVPALRRMALSATLGVGALVVTSLVLLPVLLSYAGVSTAAAARSLRQGEGGARPPFASRALERLTEPRRALLVLALAALALAGGLGAGHRGAAGAGAARGAPELRASARYNQDHAYLAAHYGQGGDRFAVIVRTRPEGCTAFETLVEADRLGWALQQLPGVTGASSLADAVRQSTAGSLEGNPRWLTLSRNQQVLDHAAQQALARTPDLFDPACSVTPVVAFLSDRRPETLDRVAGAARAFARAHGGPERAFLLAAGEAGLEAATVDAVRGARYTIALAVYGALVLLCALALRSWRATLVTLVPVTATALLCAALMAWLGIDVTVAALPVLALGVGIPDHALYLLSAQLAHQRAGLPLAEAHTRALRFTGRAVVLSAVTLAAGTATFALSPIQLQADMGLLLTFMFLGNGAAALLLVPALSRFLLPDAGGGRGAPGPAGAAAPPAASSAGRPP